MENTNNLIRGGIITSVASGHYTRPAQYLFAYLNNFNFRSENLILMVPDNNYNYELFEVLRNKNDVALLLQKQGQYLSDKLTDGVLGDNVIVVGLKKTHEVFKSVESHVRDLMFIAYSVATYHFHYIKDFGVSDEHVGVWNSSYDYVMRVIGQYWDLSYDKNFKFNFKADFKEFSSNSFFIAEFVLDMLHVPKNYNLRLEVLFKEKFKQDSSMSVILNGSLAEKYFKAMVVLTPIFVNSSRTVCYRVRAN